MLKGTSKKKSRQYLRPIVDGIILCGRQEMALQVHRDSGKIDIDDNNKMRVISVQYISTEQLGMVI